LVARADDTPQAVQARLRDYHDKTRPVLELFRAKEVIVAVEATGPAAQVETAMREQLDVDTSAYRFAADGHGSSETVGGSEPPKVTTC
jgi:hypothetical protein